MGKYGGYGEQSKGKSETEDVRFSLLIVGSDSGRFRVYGCALQVGSVGFGLVHGVRDQKSCNIID